LFNQYNQIMLNYFHIPSTVLIKITPIVRRMVVIHDEYVIEYLKSMKKVLQHQPVFSELVLLIDNRLSSEGDKAMLAKQKDADIQMPDGSEAPGGVDFNPQGLELKIKRDGNGIPLPLPQQPIEIMQIEGLTPIIINIVPANIPMILGLKKDVDVELSDNGRWQFLDRGHLQALKVSHDGVILGLKEEDGDIELSKLN